MIFAVNALVELKPDDIRPVIAADVAIQHELDVAPRTFLIPQEMQRHADQSVADGQISRISHRCCKGAKSACERQRRGEFAIVDTARPQPPKGPQPVVRIIERLCEFERRGPGRTSLSGRGRRIHHRPTKRGVQLHLAACAAA